MKDNFDRYYAEQVAVTLTVDQKNLLKSIPVRGAIHMLYLDQILASGVAQNKELRLEVYRRLDPIYYLGLLGSETERYKSGVYGSAIHWLSKVNIIGKNGKGEHRLVPHAKKLIASHKKFDRMKEFIDIVNKFDPDLKDIHMNDKLSVIEAKERFEKAWIHEKEMDMRAKEVDEQINELFEQLDQAEVEQNKVYALRDEAITARHEAYKQLHDITKEK